MVHFQLPCLIIEGQLAKHQRQFPSSFQLPRLRLLILPWPMLVGKIGMLSRVYGDGHGPTVGMSYYIYIYVYIYMYIRMQNIYIYICSKKKHIPQKKSVQVPYCTWVGLWRHHSFPRPHSMDGIGVLEFLSSRHPMDQDLETIWCLWFRSWCIMVHIIICQRNWPQLYTVMTIHAEFHPPTWQKLNHCAWPFLLTSFSARLSPVVISGRSLVRPLEHGHNCTLAFKVNMCENIIYIYVTIAKDRKYHMGMLFRSWFSLAAADCFTGCWKWFSSDLEKQNEGTLSCLKHIPSVCKPWEWWNISEWEQMKTFQLHSASVFITQLVMPKLP